MDKKAKKRVVVLRERLLRLQKSLAGAKKQTDEPDEIEQIEKELRETKSEIKTLTES